MSLTLEQRRNTLFRYQDALLGTQTRYLSMRDDSQYSNEDKNEVLDASFTLQYMMDKHEKYIRVLKLLQRDKRMQDFLNKFCEKLTINPAEDLQGFVDQAQTIMQSDEFKSELVALSSRYKLESFAYLLGGIITAVAGVGIQMAATIFLPSLIAAAVVPLMVAGLLVVGLGAFLVAYGFASPLDMAEALFRATTHSLTKESDACDLRIGHSSHQHDNDTSFDFSFTAERKGKSTNMLRDNFFKVQSSDRPSLEAEVQTEFNSLMANN